MSGCLAFTSLPGLGDDTDDPPGLVGLDLVEELHGLDQADDLPDRRRAGPTVTYGGEVGDEAA